MDKKAKYENMFIVVSIAMALGLASLGMWLLKTIHILPIIVLFSSCLLCFLFIKSFDLNNSKDDPTWLTGIVAVISIVCCAFILIGNHKDRVIVAKLFVKGNIEKEYYEYEYENGATETKYHYILKPANPSHEVVIEIIDWAIVILSMLCVYVSVKIYFKAFKLQKQQKFKKKYPKWEGELPELKD